MLAKKLYEYRGVIVFYLLFLLIMYGLSYQVKIIDAQTITNNQVKVGE